MLDLKKAESATTRQPPLLQRFLRTLARMGAERAGAIASLLWALSRTDRPYPGMSER